MVIMWCSGTMITKEFLIYPLNSLFLRFASYIHSDYTSIRWLLKLFGFLCLQCWTLYVGLFFLLAYKKFNEKVFTSSSKYAINHFQVDMIKSFLSFFFPRFQWISKFHPHFLHLPLLPTETAMGCWSFNYIVSVFFSLSSHLNPCV